MSRKSDVGIEGGSDRDRREERVDRVVEWGRLSGVAGRDVSPWRC